MDLEDGLKKKNATPQENNTPFAVLRCSFTPRRRRLIFPFIAQKRKRQRGKYGRGARVEYVLCENDKVEVWRITLWPKY